MLSQAEDAATDATPTAQLAGQAMHVPGSEREVPPQVADLMLIDVTIIVCGHCGWPKKGGKYIVTMSTRYLEDTY